MVSRRVPRFLIFTALLTISAWGLIEAKPVLLPLCLAILVAFLMAEVTDLLLRLRFPEWLALGATFVLFVCPVFYLSYEFLIQTRHLVQDIPNLIAFVNSQLEKHFGVTTLISPSRDHWIARLGSGLKQNAGPGLEVLFKSIRALVSVSSHIALVLVLAIVMVGSRKRLSRGLANFISSDLIESASRLIKRFIVVRLGVAVGVAIVDGVILHFFGLHYSAISGAFLGLMTLVPVIGFVFGVIPPLVIAAFHGLAIGRMVGLFGSLLLVSSLEAHWLTPQFLGKHLNLNLLFVFLGLFIGEAMWGAWGIFLSMPILGIVRIIFNTSFRMRPWGNLLSASRELPLERIDRKAA
jgi:predicted PurR-regulated permease PerM